MELAHIPLNQLRISTLNMRHDRKAPNVSDILPSIRARGILQPLIVRKNGKGYEVIAGRRRLFSLKAIVKDGGEIEPIPCAIIFKCDDADALEASLIENLARLDPDEMNRYETFARLVKEGKVPANIACTFGVSVQAVKRALALGNLISKIRKAYKDEKIDADTIRHLTLASKTQQSEWFKLFEDPEQYAPRGPRLKRWLFGGEIKTSVALFPLNDYKGQIIADLFGEDGYFDNAEGFWKLQNVAIAAKRDALIKSGWDEISVLDPGQYFCSWDHVKTTKKDGGRVYIEIRHSGEVKLHEGYISQKEHQNRLKKRSGGNSTEDQPTTRPELTGPAQNYISLHRHAAVRAALFGNNGVALRLMIAHAIAGSTLWQTKPEPQRSMKEATAKSLANSKSQAVFEQEKAKILKLLELDEDSHTVTRSNGDDDRLAQFFAKLTKLSDEDVMRILTFVMAETLQSGTCVVEHLGTALNVCMRETWQPDDAFFDLVRDKSAINAMLRDIGGKRVADSNISATGKVQKKIIRDFINGDGRERIENWLPRYMQFPFMAYTKAGAGTLSDNALRAKPKT